MTEPILDVRDLDVLYGPSQALFGVSVSVEAGTVVAVLGANGAGKSTLARAASGLVPRNAGSVHFDGHDVTKLSPHRIRKLGLTYIPEGRGIFPGLSVLDNLRMAVAQERRQDRAGAIDRAIERFPVLGKRRTQRAGSLSGGEQQMLALARALAVSPKLIIADEMSLGLAPSSPSRCSRASRRRAARGSRSSSPSNSSIGRWPWRTVASSSPGAGWAGRDRRPMPAKR